jgi:hypothetical protein
MSKKKDETLGDLGKRHYGGVSIFGLDAFGSPVGLNPLWGAVAGVAAEGVGEMIADKMPLQFLKDNKVYSGIALSALTGGIMAYFPGSRAAGWAAIATGATAGIMKMAAEKWGKTAMEGWGIPTIESTPTLGITTVDPTVTLGQDDSGMPTLVGDQPQLVGGPVISGIAGHFGATVIGSRN